MAKTPFFPESFASDFRVILVFWKACWPPRWDPKCPREPLYWSYSGTCLRVTVGCKLQVMWKVSGMELCFPRALVSCHQEYKRQEQSCPLTRGAVCQSLTFHERPREPSLPASSHATPEFLHKVLSAVVPPLSTQQIDRNTSTLFSMCISSCRWNACSLNILITICDPPLLSCIHVWMYLCMYGFTYLVLNGTELTFKVLI